MTMNIEIERTSKEKFQENGWSFCYNSGTGVNYFCKTINEIEITFSLYGHHAYAYICDDDQALTPSDLAAIASELKKLEEN